MIKRLICMALATLCIALALNGCGTKDNATVDEATAYPNESNIKIADCDCSTGYSYGITLKQFTNNFNAIYKDINSEKNYIDFEKWEKNKTKQKDGKVTYTNYTLSTQYYIISANIDNDSNRLLASGITTTYDLFNSTQQSGNEDVMTGAAIMAAASGCYKADNVGFFKEVYKLAISGRIYYNKVIYTVNTGEITQTEATSQKKSATQETSEDTSNMSVTFMTMPLNEKKADENWTYTNYKMYKDGKCDFGQHTKRTTQESTMSSENASIIAEHQATATTQSTSK